MEQVEGEKRGDQENSKKEEGKIVKESKRARRTKRDSFKVPLWQLEMNV